MFNLIDLITLYAVCMEHVLIQLMYIILRTVYSTRTVPLYTIKCLFVTHLPEPRTHISI